MKPNTIDSTIPESCKLYKCCRVKESTLGEGVSIGDFALVDYSTLGSQVRINRYNHVFESSLGNYSYTGMNSVLMGASIGHFCSISWNVSIGGAAHDYRRTTQHPFLYTDLGIAPIQEIPAYDRFSQPVVVGSDVWVAAGAAILRGVKVGNGAVVGANAVVTKDVSPYAIVAGSPARIIKYRFPEDIIDLLLRLKWWEWDSAKIKKHYALLSSEPTREQLESIIED